MSKCEACGGDGLIEVGAYRGDETTETRECRLCGGAITLVAELPVGLPRLLSSENGVRQVVAVPHLHEWKQPERFGPYVRFGCSGCSKGLVFSVSGSLQDGEAPNPFVLNDLSCKAVVFAAREEMKQMARQEAKLYGDQTPEQVAAEYAAQLNADNERRQREAEQGINLSERS